MGGWTELKELNREQRAAFLASFLGWTLDAFDYFLVVFVLSSIAHDFHSAVKDVALALTLTLAFRPVGALLFGWLADRHGRRPVLMVDILLYSVLELAAGFAPSLGALLILRALFGIAMGGEWGVGASLVMETIPARSRGVVSGILQEGYAFGYLLAALAYGLLYSHIGWRGLFIVGSVPALAVLYIRMSVRESPAWERRRDRETSAGKHFLAGLRGNLGRLFYVVLLMAAFNFLSHGTQDLYPTFLQVQRHFSHGLVTLVTIVGNLGAIAGGIAFGVYSQRHGRRRAIIIAAVLAIPILPLWAFASTPLLLGIGALLMQFAVQGAWGIVPAHLNELSPAQIRGTFPGFAYQLGNLIASSNAFLQADLASRRGGNYAFALAVVAGITAVALIGLTAAGPEAKEAKLA